MRTITQIFVYPIKSCAGVELQQAEVTSTGLKHDRQFILIDDNGKFLSQRRIPKMCLIKVELTENAIIASYPHSRSHLVIPHRETQTGTGIPVDVWGKPGCGIDVGNHTDEWFSDFLGIHCRLLQYDPRNPRRREAKESNSGSIPLSFADGFPILMISKESLAELNGHLENPITIDRFRPNIVVAGGNTAFEEDAWKMVSTKGTCFTGQKPCERCSMPSVDPKTGIPDEDEEPIATLKTYRRLALPSGKKFGPVIFGKNLSVARPGMVYVGNVAVAH